MVKQYELQDQYGNKIYNHTSSDIVFDLDTGRTVKQDIDLLLGAFGLSGEGGQTEDVKIDAHSLSGYTIDKLVLNETYTNAMAGLASELSLKAPLASPVFTGTPTAPDVEKGDSTTKIANTKFVSDAVTDALASVTTILEGYAEAEHTHSADDITSGTFANTDVMAMNGSDYTAARIRNISFLGESEELPSTLANGSLLAVYEG